MGKPNIIYRWKPSIDKVVKHLPSVRLFEQLGTFTGFTENEINKEVLQRKKILEWMIKKNVRNVQDVGKVMREYYLNRDVFLKLINKNPDAKKILEN